MGTKTGTMPNGTRFYRSFLALRNATLSSQDFKETLALIEEGDFVYVDPPYALPNSRNRGEYGSGAFDYKRIGELNRFLMEIDSIGAKFLLSYSNHPSVVNKLDSSWRLEVLEVDRHVAGFAKYRNTVTEVLVSNY